MGRQEPPLKFDEISNINCITMVIESGAVVAVAVAVAVVVYLNNSWLYYVDFPLAR